MTVSAGAIQKEHAMNIDEHILAQLPPSTLGAGGTAAFAQIPVTPPRAPGTIVHQQQEMLQLVEACGRAFQSLVDNLHPIIRPAVAVDVDARSNEVTAQPLSPVADAQHMLINQLRGLLQSIDAVTQQLDI